MASDELRRGAAGLLANSDGAGRICVLPERVRKGSTPGTLTLLLGSNRYSQNLSTVWQRFACTGTGDPTASSMTFGIELGPGAVVDIYGLQVEPQDSPSLYKPSTTGGCYENARLRDDILSFTTTDVNRHSATVNILYANNL